ncbi:MAG: phosphoglycerate dehydrogenase [Sedimentisphaerales bacterium]|nr:phosphoglycerate dehydrogenase [Sedimentisphaerales bacterium]
MIKILVTDKLAQEGLDLLANMDDVEVTVKTGVSEDELAGMIGQYDGLIIRSGTQVTAKVLENSGRLKGVARAGVGVDNVDITVATQKGVMVMNTPDGNTISAAEHTIALMMAMSRYVVQGCTSLKAGKWDRKKFMGTQLMGKTLGVVGMGRIGMAVARRAQGLKMKVLGFDPLAAPDNADELGIEVIANLDELIGKCDYLTLHVPVTDETRGMINAERIAKMKPTARIINVARGPVINEDDLYAALKEGKIAGAALDVFAQEPPENRGFEELDNCIVTPHLGASTEEAQIEVAIDAAKELVEAIRGTQVRNAVNVPGLDKTLPEIVRNYRGLAERLGLVLSTITPGKIKKVEVTYRGDIAQVDASAVTTAFTVGLLQKHFDEPLNIVNAPVLAKQRGISFDVVTNAESHDFAHTMSVRLVTDQADRTIKGTIVGKDIPRVIGVDDFAFEMSPEGTIMIIFNDDKPGVIGSVGSICGKHSLNIGTMGVGRLKDQNKAVLAISMDKGPEPEAIKEFQKLDFVKSVYVIEFPNS